ncbi:WD-40 repeat protein [Reticulomyxa filosa]|uniref:WD-40 repeat protein n=1 Tax=Reticulomyxa filosa TaxID=46433 RepID=X6M7P5_RETFI|nr:WD-40 repeat protein [Reticulomyxa filosa]|eukprot:ETO09055.1 WD-40 repeat protein [Reticulomyxa filosa]
MIKLENQTTEEKKSGEAFLSAQQACFNKNYFLELDQHDQLNDFICLICKQIVYEPFEINCTQHQNLDGLLLVGEHCLKKFLNDNPNSCPVEPHGTCQYAKSRLAQRYINELKITCPRQLAQSQQQKGKANDIICNFVGKLKELNAHLNNSCPLNSVDCWFKPFGCNHNLYKHELQEHLTSKMRFHFDLVIKSFDTLKQTIQSLQNELIQLQSQNQQLHLQIQSKKKKDEKDLALLKNNTVLEYNKKYQYFLNLFFFYIYNEIIVEIAKLKKATNNKLEQIHVQEDIQKSMEIIQSKEKQQLRKEIEINNIKKEDESGLPELSVGLDNMETDFFDSDKQISSHHDQQKESFKTQDYKSNIPNKNTDIEFKDKFFSSTANLDSFYHAKLMKTFTGHSGIVWSVDYSPFDNGRFLCSGSCDKTVCLWDVNASKLLKIFNGHSDYIRCVKFSPYHYHKYSRYIICSASIDETIRFWDFESKNESQILKGHNLGICSIQFSPFSNGQYLCSGSWDKTVRLWDIETLKLLQIFNGHTNRIWCVTFSPLQSNANVGIVGGSGYTICSGSSDDTIRLWDVGTAKELIDFKGHTDGVMSVKYLNENIICSGSVDKTIRLWDIRSKKDINVFKGHADDINCVDFPPFGSSCDGIGFSATNIICSGSWDNTIRFWDVRTNRQLHEIKGCDNDGGIDCLQFAPLKSKCDYSTTLCYGSLKGFIRMWE